MLRSLKELMGYKLAASDGSIGKVKDFLFDEQQWTVRWMVADTGDWLPKRKVLISPIALGEPDWTSNLFPVHLTKSQIESAPSLATDEPVSREYETRFFDQYGWRYYWTAAGVWADPIAPGQMAPGQMAPGQIYTRQEKVADLHGKLPEEGSHVLRSTEEVMGYHIQTVGDEIGHVEDFIVEDVSWTVRYMVVDTRNWLPGRKVLIAPDWIETIKWADRKVAVGLMRDEIEGSPEYDPSAPVNRDYESRLYDYYGRPVYWSNS